MKIFHPQMLTIISLILSKIMFKILLIKIIVLQILFYLEATATLSRISYTGRRVMALADYLNKKSVIKADCLIIRPLNINDAENCGN